MEADINTGINKITTVNSNKANENEIKESWSNEILTISSWKPVKITYVPNSTRNVQYQLLEK